MALPTPQNMKMHQGVITSLDDEDWLGVAASGFRVESIGLKSKGMTFRDQCGFSRGGTYLNAKEKGIDLTDDVEANFRENPEFAEIVKELDYRDDVLQNRVKAAGTVDSVHGGSGTAAPSVVSPIDFERDIWDVNINYTPFITGIVPMVTTNQTLIPYNRMTARPSMSMVTGDAALSATKTTLKQVYASMKYYAMKGRVTWVADATIKPFRITPGGVSGSGQGSSEPRRIMPAPDARMTELTAMQRSIDEGLEEQILTGDGTGNNMTGVLTQINTVDSDNGYPTRNRKNLAGTTELTLDHIDQIINFAVLKGGRPNLLLSTPNASTKLRELLSDKRIYHGPTVTMPWGTTYIAFDTEVGRIPLITSKYCNLGGKENIWALDMNFNNIAAYVLRPRTYYEIPSQTPAREFMLYGGLCGAVHNPNLCSYIYDIHVGTDISTPD